MTSMKESSCESCSALSCSSEFIATRSFFSTCRRATWARSKSSSASWWTATVALKIVIHCKSVYIFFFKTFVCFSGQWNGNSSGSSLEVLNLTIEHPAVPFQSFVVFLLSSWFWRVNVSMCLRASSSLLSKKLRSSCCFSRQAVRPSKRSFIDRLVWRRASKTRSMFIYY